MTDPQQREFYVPERAVVICAHHDDIEFGVAGTVARWVEAGAQVTYVIMTNGASGSNAPDVLRRDLIATRQREQDAAARAVGVTDVRYLGLEDGHVVPTLAGRRDLTRIIREVRPQVVVTMDPTVVISAGRDYVNHPDHRAVGEMATYATFPSAGSRPIFRELLVEGYEPHDVEMLWLMLTNDVTHKVDISSVIEKKKAALACHSSQLNQDVIDMVIGWNKDAATDTPYDYVESFRVVDFRR
ncbi:MAG: PIG-L deacetylase family protein [Chloroflexota bacterium]